MKQQVAMSCKYCLLHTPLQALHQIIGMKRCRHLSIEHYRQINIYLKKLGREKRIPFEVSVDPFYSDENIQRLKKSIAQMETTGGTIHEVDFDDKGLDG